MQYEGQERKLSHSKAHQVTGSLSQLMMRLPISSPARVLAQPTIPPPNMYSSDPTKCKGFLLQCQLYFGAIEDLLDLAKTNFKHFF